MDIKPRCTQESRIHMNPLFCMLAQQPPTFILKFSGTVLLQAGKAGQTSRKPLLGDSVAVTIREAESSREAFCFWDEDFWYVAMVRRNAASIEWLNSSMPHSASYSTGQARVMVYPSSTMHDVKVSCCTSTAVARAVVWAEQYESNIVTHALKNCQIAIAKRLERWDIFQRGRLVRSSDRHLDLIWHYHFEKVWKDVKRSWFKRFAFVLCIILVVLWTSEVLHSDCEPTWAILSDYRFQLWKTRLNMSMANSIVCKIKMCKAQCSKIGTKTYNVDLYIGNCEQKPIEKYYSQRLLVSEEQHLQTKSQTWVSNCNCRLWALKELSSWRV